MIERIAHRVSERILDGFEQALVELRLLAVHLEIHAAAERVAQVADQARHLGKHIGYGLHARLHHRLAQIGRHHIEAARKQRHVGIGRRGLQYLVACEHQFAHQVHHAVEQRHVHAQRALRRGPLRARFGSFGGRQRCGLGNDFLRFRCLSSHGNWTSGWLIGGLGGSWLRLRGGGPNIHGGSGSFGGDCLARFPGRGRAFGFRGLRGSLQLREPRNQSGVVSFTVVAFGFDRLQYFAEAVEQRQKRGNHRGAGRHFAIAQQAEKILAGMSQLFQPLIAKESRGSLDGVHGAEDLSQKLFILRPFLQFRKAPLHAVQPILALDQELPYQIVHGSHSSPGRAHPARRTLKSLIGKLGAQLEKAGDQRVGNKIPPAEPGELPLRITCFARHRCSEAH